MDWKAWIKTRGIDKTATALSLSYETVRNWTAGALPSSTNLKALVALARIELPTSDFDAFMASLSADLFGVTSDE